MVPTVTDDGWSTRLARILIAGTAAGGAAMLSFMAIHSVLIAPIWTRAANGLPLALIGGIAIAAAFDRVTAPGRRQTIFDGARFGALMFAALIPATAFSNALRIAGLEANGWPGITGSLATAAASGAAVGWLLTRARDGALALAGAAAALVIAMAGPVPVVNGPRAAWLFIGFLPICIGAGAVVAAVRRRIVEE
jgi:hypothetical protein